MDGELFSRVAAGIGATTVIVFLALVWLNLSWLAVIVFIAGLTLIYLLKTTVKEPIIDERIMKIQEKSTTRAGQVFAILMMLTIIGLAISNNKRLVPGLEVSLAVFLILKLVFTRYYEVKM